MATGDDLELDWFLKIVRRQSGASSTTYTMNQVFTWIQQQIPQPQNMDDDEIMTAETPTAYTIKDNWFWDVGDGSLIHKYISGGALQTNQYNATSEARGIRLLKFASGGYTNAVAGDIGREVGYSGGTPTDTGTLLSYNNTKRWWYVRVDDTGDTFANTTTAIDLDDGAGTGAGTLIDPSTTGECTFARPRTLGAFPGSPDPQFYLFQDGKNIPEWWDRGNIDIMVEVKTFGREIDDQELWFYSRQQGDTFSHYQVATTTSGQDVVVLETSTDVEDTVPDYYIFYDNEASGPFAVGDLIWHPAGAESAADWAAEVVSIDDWGTEGALGIRAYSYPGAAMADGDTFTNGTATADINGSGTGVLGTGYILFTSQTGAYATGLVLTGGTSGAERRIIGQQDDGTTGKLLFDTNTGIMGAARNPYYRDFNYTPTPELITDSGTGSAAVNSTTYNATAGFSDITLSFVNGTVGYTSGDANSWVYGERVTYSGGEAIILADTNDGGASGTITLGNVTNVDLNTKVITGDISTRDVTASEDLQFIHTADYNFTQQTAYPYACFVEGGSIYEAGRSLADVYQYIKFVVQEDSSFNMYKLRDTLKYAYAYNYDGGGSPTFTNESVAAKSTTANSINLLAGATEQEDAYYFGSDEEFNTIRINIGTDGSGVWTVTWEYWNGAWTALSNVDDETDSFGGGTPTGTGWKWIRWDLPADWVRYDPASDDNKGYYVRARISSWTSLTTAPLGTTALNLTNVPETGEEYVAAFWGFAEKKPSPLGQKLGVVLFGAQGVWFQGIATSDANNLSLLDANGTVRAPYQSITVRMSALVSGATAYIARESGGVSEQYFTSPASGNDQGDLDFVVTEAIPIDTPDVGVLKVVDTTTGLDHRYRYASWNSGTKTFALRTKVGAYACTGGGTGTLLQDTVNDFTALDIKVGDVIRNETDDSWAHVVQIVDADNIITTKLQGGGDNTWTATDNYSLHSLVVAYGSSDTAYVPYIDEIATGTSAEVVVLYPSTSRSVLAKARKAGKKPFKTTGTLDSGGYSVAAIIPDEPQFNL